MEETQNQQNQPMPQEPQANNNFINKKNIIIGVVIVLLLLIGLGVWIWRGAIYKNDRMPYDMPQYQKVEQPLRETQIEVPQDTTSAINNDLNSINIESIDDSFKEIDADLNNL